MVVIRGRLTPEAGAVLMQALAAARETPVPAARGTDAASSAEDVSAETSSMAQQQADALALLAETALHHGIDPGAPGERYQVVVHVDAPVLADPERARPVRPRGRHARFRGNVPPPGVRRDPGGDATRSGWANRGSWRADADHSTGAPARAAPPRPRLPVPGLRRARSVRVITSATGPRAGPPRSRTSRCCVGAITAPSTRRDTRWNDSPTANYGSGDRTEDLCRTSRLHRRSPTIPSRRSARGTRRLAFACTRARRAPAGWANASTWVGRSTSCTRGPSSPWRSVSRPGEPARPVQGSENHLFATGD